MTSPTLILDFFPENALGHGPKNSRIRVKTSLFDVDKFDPNWHPFRHRLRISIKIFFLRFTRMNNLYESFKLKYEQ